MLRLSALRLTIRAVMLKSFGGVDQLEVRDVPKPVINPESNQVLIKVMAAGVNRADISQRRGHYPPPPGCSDVLGLEVSGYVEQVGSQAKGVKEGDKVMALLTGGGYAEYAVASAGCVMAMPHGYSFEESASIPEAFITAWQALKMHGDLRAGQRVLIHAGASGVGIAASQLVEKYFEATAVTTSSESKVDVCRSFASVNLNRTPDENGLCFAPKVRAALGEECIDLVIDPVFGGTYAMENASVLAPRGTVVVLSFLGGGRVNVNALPFYRQRAHIIFSKLREQEDAYRTSLVDSFEKALIPYMKERVIVPYVTRAFPLDQVAAAHAAVESNKSVGKCVLQMEPRPEPQPESAENAASDAAKGQ